MSDRNPQSITEARLRSTEIERDGLRLAAQNAVEGLSKWLALTDPNRFTQPMPANKGGCHEVAKNSRGLDSGRLNLSSEASAPFDEVVAALERLHAASLAPPPAGGSIEALRAARDAAGNILSSLKQKEKTHD